MRRIIFSVTLVSGVTFLAKIYESDLDAFMDYLDNSPSVSSYEQVTVINKIGPHSSGRTKMARARMAANMTQQQVADALGVRVKQYQRWEYNKNPIKAYDLLRISKILGVDCADLMEME